MAKIKNKNMSVKSEVEKFSLNKIEIEESNRLRKLFLKRVVSI